ncbi:MAG: DUF4824 family protein [Nitrosomonadales bacterium]|nr:DUF4824 family protein [Nitrosomonadales bacterium]
MMKWSRTLIAGSALILLTNAVALGGAGYNRSGDPESRLQLTQRELQHSTWRSGKDNSGITLTLNWRFEQAEDDSYNYGVYSSRWGMPVWLDKAKLAELGFDVEELAGTEEVGRRNRREQSKEVMLVLELDGQSYQRHLQRARAYAEESKKLSAASPGNTEMQRRAEGAEKSFRHEQDQGSRLFVIDAGLDLQKLRAAYPDRVRYAIVRGLIQPTAISEQEETRIAGYVRELHAERINVPLAYRGLFGNSTPFEVTVAFGKRLEPWIVAGAGGATN